MEQASLRLMQALQSRGHHLSVLSLHSLGLLAPKLSDSGIQVIGLDYGKISLWNLIKGLRRELRRQKPDALLLTGHSLPVLLAITGFCRSQRLLTIHFHHTGVKRPNFWRLYYSLAFRLVHTVTFPTDFVRNEALSLCPFLASKAHTVRYPLNPTAPTNQEERVIVREKFNLPADAAVIGNAGWLIPRKRFDIFLKIAAEIYSRHPNSCFIIAGEGPERQNLELLARSLGIHHAVIWAGWVADMSSFYASLDLLLFNSDWDALGLTPLEACIHGIPVVCSVLHGGLPEVLRPGVDAVVLDHHDIPSLAAAALEVLADPATAIAKAVQVRDRVLSLSNPDQIAAWHERAFTREARR